MVDQSKKKTLQSYYLNTGKKISKPLYIGSQTMGSTYPKEVAVYMCESTDDAPSPEDSDIQLKPSHQLAIHEVKQYRAIEAVIGVKTSFVEREKIVRPPPKDTKLKQYEPPGRKSSKDKRIEEGKNHSLAVYLVVSVKGKRKCFASSRWMQIAGKPKSTRKNAVNLDESKTATDKLLERAKESIEKAISKDEGHESDDVDRGQDSEPESGKPPKSRKKKAAVGKKGTK